MKTTAYDRQHNIDLSGGVGVTSLYYGKTSLGSNTPLVESGAGTPGSGPQASAWDHVHPAAGGSSSAFGSNSTRVSSVSAAGASSSNSRADHVHDGIGGATASSSNTLNRGNLNLRAGSNIALGLSNTDGGTGFDTVTINSLASGGAGGGVTSLAKSGSSALTGAVTLTGGTGVTLTQTGQDISIAASSSGSGLTVPKIYQIKAAGNAATAVTVTAAASGRRFVMMTNATTGQVTAVACTNTTWTQVLTMNDGTGFLAIWVGVVAGGSSGTSITMTKPGAFNTVLVYEIDDTLTPTLTASVTGTLSAGVGLVSTHRLSGTTAGRLLVFATGNGNTTNPTQPFPSVPCSGQMFGIGNAMALGYAVNSEVTSSAGQTQMAMIAEIT